MLAPDAYLEFPFLHLVVTDQATFDATVGPFLADLSGLTFSEPTFVDLKMAGQSEPRLQRRPCGATVDACNLLQRHSQDRDHPFLVEHHTSVASFVGAPDDRRDVL